MEHDDHDAMDDGLPVAVEMTGDGWSGDGCSDEGWSGDVGSDVERFSHLDVKTFPSEYGSFKKWFAKGFNQLCEAAEAGRLPDAAIADRFVMACRRMTELDGRGSETFTAFLASAQRFAEAVRGGDPEAGRAALDTLEAHRRRCHARYR